MYRKQLQRLIAASVVSGALSSGIAWADDMPMDKPMPGNTVEKTKPTDTSTDGTTTKKMKPVDTSTDANASAETMPAKHRRHGHKKMKEGMGMPDKMGGMKDMPADTSK